MSRRGVRRNGATRFIGRRGWLLLRLAVGAGLIAYLAASGALEWRRLSAVAGAWPLALTGLLLLAAALALTAWRLCIVVAPIGMHLSLLASARLTLLGTFFNAFLPGGGGGDVVRIYYAARGNEGRRTEIVAALLLDRVAGLFGLCLLPIIVAPVAWSLVRDNAVLRSLLWIAIAMGAAGALGTVILASPALGRSSALRRLIGRLPGNEHLLRARRALQSHVASPAALLAAVLLSLLVHVLVIGSVVLLARGAGVAEWDGLRPLVLIAPLGFLANAIPLTPGGIGVGEAAFEALFRLAGLSGGAETLLAWRILMLLLGLGGLAVYLAGQERYLFSRPEAGPGKTPAGRASTTQAGREARLL